jgi:hypothetical protein
MRIQDIFVQTAKLTLIWLLEHILQGRCSSPEKTRLKFFAGNINSQKTSYSSNRTDETFFKPTESFEITGQVGNVCFLEGLVFFNGKWLLYYGTADSKIAVAEAVMYDYRGMLDQRAKARKEEAMALNERENEEEVFHHTVPRVHQDYLNRVHQKLQDPPKEFPQEQAESNSVETIEAIDEIREEKKLTDAEYIEVSEIESQAGEADVVAEEL